MYGFFYPTAYGPNLAAVFDGKTDGQTVGSFTAAVLWVNF